MLSGTSPAEVASPPPSPILRGDLLTGAGSRGAAGAAAATAGSRGVPPRRRHNVPPLSQCGASSGLPPPPRSPPVPAAGHGQIPAAAASGTGKAGARPARGFSYVDLVEGLRDGRFYALKRILCHDKEDRQAALHEVEMHGLFDHPNILRLVAHCMVEKGAKHEAWLLLPYVKGGTLWREVEALREKGTFMPEERILLILHGICRGLQAIHSKGYAHRDLKPTNVLLDEDDRPVLMDLGSMNKARIEVNSSRKATAVQDWAAQRCTISYRAPELFTVPSQCVIDERTDIWSLGCVLYCMMFGEGPYDAIFQKGDSVALAVQNPIVVPPTTRYSAALQNLLSSMMTLDPQERPNINDVLHQLEGLQPVPAGQDTTQI